MADKISHDEFCARGGRSRSPAKTAAVLRNLAKAQAVQNARRAAKKSALGDLAKDGLLSPGRAGKLSARTP